MRSENKDKRQKKIIIHDSVHTNEILERIANAIDAKEVHLKKKQEKRETSEIIIFIKLKLKFLCLRIYLFVCSLNACDNCELN